MMWFFQLCWQYRKFVGAMLGVIALYLTYMLWHHHVFELGQLKERAAWVIRWDERDKADAKAVADELERQKLESARQEKLNAQITQTYRQQLLAIAGDRDSLARRVREYQDRYAALSGAMQQAKGEPGANGAGAVPSGPQTIDRLSDDLDAACRADAAQLDALRAEVAPLVELSP
jgi:hypothetical protein